MASTISGLSPRWGIPRERNAILVGLTGVTVLSWIYVAHEAQTMNGSSMTQSGAMGQMRDMAGMHTWTATYFGLVLGMWAVMMVAMMTPTAVPMTLVYTAVLRKATGSRGRLVATYVFVAGYLTVWGVFSVVAAAAQWALDRTALLSSTMASNSAALGSALLIAAGVYQFSPVKDACLEQCRAPAHFLSRHWHAGLGGAYRMGLRLGTYCLGCCWAIMVLLFVGGVMNLVWVALIAAFVLIEKTLPYGRQGGRVVGVVMIGVGLLGAIGLVGID